MTIALFWERNVGKLLTPRHDPVFRQTADMRRTVSAATYEPTRVTTPSDSGDRTPKPGLIATLAAILEHGRSARERRILARFAGRRWCDSVERQVTDALGNFDRRKDPFQRY